MRLAPAVSLRGAVGKIVALSRNCPVPSMTATLQPVRKPGSRPIVTSGPAGAAINSSRMFFAKTEIASSSALVFSCCISVESAAGCSSRR